MVRSARVGVVADTHVGEFLDELPPGVAGALAGCDLILHAGDLSHHRVLDDLRRIAPVVAVRGDHDLPGGPRLPASTVVRIAGVRIGLTHGARSRVTDASVVVAGLLGARRYRAGLAASLARRFGPVDAIVHGHWHEPVTERRGATLIFSPGAVCPWGSLEGGRSPRPGMAGVADRAVRRYRRTLGPDAMMPRVGIISVAGGVIRARSIPLPVEYPSPS